MVNEHRDAGIPERLRPPVAFSVFWKRQRRLLCIQRPHSSAAVAPPQKRTPTLPARFLSFFCIRPLCPPSMATSSEDCEYAIVQTRLIEELILRK